MYRTKLKPGKGKKVGTTTPRRGAKGKGKVNAGLDVDGDEGEGDEEQGVGKQRKATRAKPKETSGANARRGTVGTSMAGGQGNAGDGSSHSQVMGRKVRIVHCDGSIVTSSRLLLVIQRSLSFGETILCDLRWLRKNRLEAQIFWRFRLADVLPTRSTSTPAPPGSLPCISAAS